MTTHALELRSLDVVHDHETPAEPGPCSNCGAEGAEKFCPKCGEQQPGHHDYSVGHFLGHALHELLHVDSKALVTLRLLITKPGQLTVDYFAGRKTRYITPLRLFLTLFTMFFLAFTLYKPVSPFRVETVARHDAKSVNFLLDKVAKRTHMTREQVVERIDEKWQHTISLLQLANILAVGIVLALVTAGGGRYFAEHLVFGSHYLGFTYIVSLASWPARYFVGIDPGVPSRIVGIVVSLITFAYLHVAMKRYYGTGFLSSVFAFAGIFVSGAVLMVGPFIAAIFLTAFH